MSAVPPDRTRGLIPVVLSATALVSFMPGWRAVALAFAELGAGAFYLVGVVHPALGPSAPWFLLAACVASLVARAIDVESWTLFVPGGLVGRAGRDIGGFAARVAAAAVLAERFLLAALASVVFGHYVSSVVVTAIAGWQLSKFVTFQDIAAPVAIAVLGALWLHSRRGLELGLERLSKGIWVGLGILAGLIVYEFVVLGRHGGLSAALASSRPALPQWDLSSWGAVLAGLALTLPALGGGDALARVARDLPPPRVPALRRVAFLVASLGLVFTVVPALLFSGLLEATQQTTWLDAPLAGLAHALGGPHWVRDLLASLVCVSAGLMLAPAAYGAMRDAAHALRRLAVARAVPESLAFPHRQFGTMTRAFDAATAAAVVCVFASSGRVTWLSRAYAVVVVVSLVLRVATLVRFRTLQPGPRPFTVPLNLSMGGRRVPLGALVVGACVAIAALALLVRGDIPSMAGAGLLVGLTLLLNAPVQSEDVAAPAADVDGFELLPASEVSLGDVEARPGNVLVCVRNPHALAHLSAALDAAGDRETVAVTVRLLGVDVEDEHSARTSPTLDERILLTQVMAVAERHARPVRLLVVPARNVFDAVAATAVRLQSSEVYVGESASLAAADQARLLGEAWERAHPPDGLKSRLVVQHRSGRADAYHLGAHPPSLTPADLDLIHRLWLDVTKDVGTHVHHHDVVRAALNQMAHQLDGEHRDVALTAVRDVARPADDLAAAVRAGDYARLRDVTRNRHAGELAAILPQLRLEDQVVVFRVLPRRNAAAVFEYLSHEAQEALLKTMAQEDVAGLLNSMAPDDRTMFLEELPAAATRQLLSLLTPAERGVAVTLLGYPDDSIGRLMTPQYVAVREHWTIREVLDYIRAHGHDSETLNVVYVVDDQELLIDDIRIRELLLTSLDHRVSDLMDRRFVALKATDNQREAVAVFRRYDRTALPVTDTAGTLIGIVTIDDVLDVAEAAATQEIQRIGGSEALDEPYMKVGFWRMVQKRGGWLTALFLGEMLTATAMGAFEEEIAKAVVLALFVPLIISSGGNSGSQASTLVIRALALGEVGLADWWRVMRREILAGLTLGGILGSIGFLRITLWSAFSDIYGPHWLLVAVTVALALVGIVLWGTLIGSLLPFLLRRLGFDPATSSAPFVATLVDVTGLIIYFSVALVVLRGTLL